MKKILFIIGAIAVVIGLSIFGFNKCSSKDNSTKTELNSDIDGVISVENYIAKDMAVMDTISSDYVWYETNIKMTGEVDTLDIPSLDMVSNVFQVITKFSETSFNTDVYCGKHTGGKDWFDVKKNAFWIEDYDLMPYKGKLISFTEAFERLKQANCPKPKSAYCCLRKQVGAVDCNPQYVFGNDQRGLAWVDAVTGAVSTVNPAFGDIKTLKAVTPEAFNLK